MDRPREISMIHRIAGRWLACLLMATAGPCAVAEPLTLARALERVAASNPSLAAEVAQVDSVRVRAERQAMAPPFTLGAEIENFAGTGELHGFDSAESTLQLSRVIELGGKRASRRVLGEAEIAQADHARMIARLDAFSLATQRFAEVVADQERLALANERVQLAGRTRQEVERVVHGARNPETDLRGAEIALAEAELEREHAEHELRAARVTLASTWGARHADFDRAVLPLDQLAEPEAFDVLVSRLPGSSALRALNLEAEATIAREQVVAAESRPDLTLSLGVRRLEAFGDQGLVMAMSLPLGTASRARLSQAEARADSTSLAYRREAVAIDHYQQLFEHYQELGHARTEFHALTQSMIPKAHQALALATRGFELGRFPFISLAQAQQAVFELRRRRIDAALRYHTLFARLQRQVAAAEAP
jgi:cobalt-zinc-cadmium efflux system outer membrane protein